MFSSSLVLRRALLSLVLLGLPAAGDAQQVSMSAVLPVASPTGSGTRNLSFGVITPAGPTTTVAVPAARLPLSGNVHSGEFRFDVAMTAGLEFGVDVPAVLTGPSSETLALSAAGNQFGGWCVVALAGACALSSFDPTSGAVIRACPQLLGNGICHPSRTWSVGSVLAVYVGGVLTVPSNVAPGVYSGTITLTITQVY